MSISNRVARLRQQSLQAVPSISAERARLMTDFYRSSTVARSIPHAARTGISRFNGTQNNHDLDR